MDKIKLNSCIKDLISCLEESEQFNEAAANILIEGLEQAPVNQLIRRRITNCSTYNNGSISGHTSEFGDINIKEQDTGNECQETVIKGDVRRIGHYKVEKWENFIVFYYFLDSDLEFSEKMSYRYYLSYNKDNKPIEFGLLEWVSFKPFFLTFLWEYLKAFLRVIFTERILTFNCSPIYQTPEFHFVFKRNKAGIFERNPAVSN